MIKQNLDNSSLRMISGIKKVLSAGSESIEEFRKYLNKKRFRVSDTSLSYRQVNSLDSNKVLQDDRKNKAGWRQFSFKELIFFSIIKELRTYGFRDEQLKNLRNAFFKGRDNLNSDLAIIGVLAGVKVFLTINSSNEVYFYDLLGFDIYKGEKYKSFVNVNLNEIVMELWEKAGKKRIEYDTHFKLFSKIINDFDLNEKEAEIIKIIRNKEYKSITVKKNGDKDFIVKGEKATKLEEKDLLETIKKKDFADIQVVKRDGNIVNVKVEETYKF